MSERLAVDADGFVWWHHADGTWSMARTNPDNSPIPQPVTYFVPTEEMADLRAELLEAKEARDHFESIGAAHRAEIDLLTRIVDQVDMDPFTFPVRLMGRPTRWDVAHGGVEHRREPGACSLCDAIATYRGELPARHITLHDGEDANPTTERPFA